MNKTYRLIWNEITGSWIAVAEIARSRGKRASGVLLLVVTGNVLAAPAANELPTGGQVTAGSASVSQSGTTMNVNQGSNRAVIDWQTYNVGSAATVNYNQPSASSVTLNRVHDSNPSQIFGHINANGQVFLTNPNGVYFSPSATADVGGLVATTHDISNADFMAGNNRLTRNGASGSVINDGNLTASLGGYIALLAPEVRNHGIIIARLGTVALAAGDAYTLQFAGGQLAGVQVAPSTINALVDNGNAIQAPGGLIILSALAASTLQGSVVNNSGTLAANSLTSRGGVIRLESDTITLAAGSKLDASGATGGGTVLVGGDWQGSGTMHQATAVTLAAGATIDASATQNGNGGKVVLWSDVHNVNSQTRAYGTILAKGGANGGNGGRIETSGHWLDVAGINANASAANGIGGQWLLDPVNVTITAAADAGGAMATGTWTPNATGSNISVTTIQNALNLGSNVTITTTGGLAEAGNINVNASIAKTLGGTATLQLQANNNIVIAAGVGITSTAGGLNVTLNSDSDAVGGGAIVMNTGSSITSNGGNITFGGGSNPATTAAIGNATYTNGILLSGATLDAGAGNISLRGTGSSTGGTGVNLTGAIVRTTTGAIDINGTGAGGGGSNIGVFLSGATVQTTGGGNIALTGQGSLVGTGANNEGVKLDANSLAEVQTGSGTLTMNGTGGTGTSWNIGVNVRVGSIVRLGSSATGGMFVTGTGGSCSVTGGWGVLAEGGGIYESLGAGAISLTGTGGTGADNKGIKITGASNRIGSASMTGDITLMTDSIDLSSVGSVTVRSSGKLTVKQKTAGTTIGIAGGAGTLQLLASYFGTTFINGFSGVTIGDATAGALTVGGATTFGNNTALVSGGNIAINGNLNATGKTLTLTGGNAATVSGSGNITATNLLLNGSGANYVLNTATGNSVGTLAVSNGSGNISFFNSSALTVGTVGGINGISSGGTVDVETLTGNLAVAQNIVTTNAGTAAIILNAGRSVAAGTASGGDLISGGGTISTGVGGRATLLTGSLTGSSGVAAMAGAGHYRYNSDEVATNFTTALGGGTFAIYREQPILTVTANNASRTYDGQATTGGNGVTYSGFVNGETSAVLSGTLTYRGTSQGAINAGSYTLTPGGLSNGLGYALNYANGVLTINVPTPTPTPTPTPAPVPPIFVLPQPQILPPVSMSSLSSADDATSTSQTSTSTLASNTPVTDAVAGDVASGPATSNGGTVTPDATSGGSPAATSSVDAGDAQPEINAVSSPTVGTLAMTLSSADNPVAALDSIAESRVQTAISKGMNPAQAERAGNAFNEAVVLQLSRGISMDEAVAHAAQVFTAEANFPAPQSQQQAAVKNLVASGDNVASQLTELAQAQTPSGSATFDAVLASSLARGMSFSDAVIAAQGAAHSADALAGADNSPQSTLANGGADTGMFANQSGAFQQALSSLLARGYTPEQALRRANRIAGDEAAAARADARNPASSLASGDLSALPDASSSFDAALGAALVRGLPLSEALMRAQQIDAAEQRATEADLRNPTAGFSSGRSIPAAADAVFDQAVASAIARGETPGRALVSAQRVTTRLAVIKPSAASALASGEYVDAMLLGEASSNTYRTVLSNALSRGVPVDKAIAQAQRAEQANAFRYRLPASLVRKLPSNGAKLTITAEDGKPLPSWLHFSPKLNGFVAKEVPDGALPMKVTIRVGNRRYSVDII